MRHHHLTSFAAFAWLVLGSAALRFTSPVPVQEDPEESTRTWPLSIPDAHWHHPLVPYWRV